MTEQEKRFKILKKESYEKECSKNEKRAVLYSVNVGLGSAIAVMFLSGTVGMEPIHMVVGALSSVNASYYLVNTIKSICKATAYERQIEDIDRELEMLEQNESRGMKRW